VALGNHPALHADMMDLVIGALVVDLVIDLDDFDIGQGRVSRLIQAKKFFLPGEMLLLIYLVISTVHIASSSSSVHITTDWFAVLLEGVNGQCDQEMDTEHDGPDDVHFAGAKNLPASQQDYDQSGLVHDSVVYIAGMQNCLASPLPASIANHARQSK